MIAQGLRQKVKIPNSGITAAPYKPHATPDAGFQGMRRYRLGMSGTTRHCRQQCAAHAHRHHLTNGLKAGGAEIPIGVAVCRAANRQCLVAQAMTFGQQKQPPSA